MIHDKLIESNPFAMASVDSTRPDYLHFRTFVMRLQELTTGAVPFTIRIQDPMANTFIYSPFAPSPDPRLTVSSRMHPSLDISYLVWRPSAPACPQLAP